ncbi:hypothetical protein EOPP23_14375 [Endozoicomonas sp. OPT23]|uniref:hypothetical protein n=1 Tax=Endozoicomonas sp. OPT23 TaxID=2072845 RepID=UPI00129A2C2E|nr:hypothetical protein [Endozoicomonas sp. OPT23]MRI34176.1 hypothetical protein [Endozoicomonas sp. OPT23]
MELLNITNLKSLITFTHLAGLAFGLGGAWILDLFIVRYFRSETVSEERYQFLEFVSKLVLAGLVILWVSGLLFVLYYYLYTPEYLYNQKVWAKTFIVTVLSLNGVMIHRKLMPVIKRSIGKNLLVSLSLTEIRSMLTIGTVSVVSWVFPVVLGVAKTLNFSATAIVIAISYLVILAITLMLVHMLFNMINQKPKQLQID